MIDLTSCPECGQPAEVLWRNVLYSTDGPIEHARLFCLRGHGFFVPVDSLPAIPAPDQPQEVHEAHGSTTANRRNRGAAH
jgi:hypothetical protein